jgi:hypothetical protein
MSSTQESTLQISLQGVPSYLEEIMSVTIC